MTKRFISMGQISEGTLQILEEYIEKQKNGEGTAIVIEAADFQDEWKMCLEYLAALPYMEDDPCIYSLNDVADWIDEKIDAGGLSLEEIEALHKYLHDKPST